MAGFAELFTFSATVSTTELSLTGGTSTIQTRTTAGVFWVFIDGVANMAKGDSFKIRVYEKTRSADTQRQVDYWTMSGVQDELWTSPQIGLLNGWDFTIVRTAGADRAITASVRSVT